MIREVINAQSVCTNEMQYKLKNPIIDLGIWSKFLAVDHVCMPSSSYWLVELYMLVWAVCNPDNEVANNLTRAQLATMLANIGYH